MSQGNSKVTSIESLERFHKAMIHFSEEGLSSLEKIRCEALRRIQYIETQLPAKWNAEHSKWKQKMKDAFRELNSSKTSAGRLAAEQLYRQAQSHIKKSEEKIELLKKWQKRLPMELPEYQSRLMKLKTFLVNDFEKKTNLIKKHANTLHEYSQIDKGTK